MSDATKRIIAKIQALRAKTVAAGATEAEAASAAAAAQRLMAQYQIDEVNVRDADFEAVYIGGKGLKGEWADSHPFVLVSPGVAHISGCEIMLNARRGLLVIGDAVGREIADYLLDMVYNTLEASWRQERRTRETRITAFWARIDRLNGRPVDRRHPVYLDKLRATGLSTDRTTRKSYLTAMAAQLSERLLAMPPARRTPADVLARLTADMAIVDPAKQVTAMDRDAHAALAGRTAGGTAGLGLGVGGRPEPQRIGMS